MALSNARMRAICSLGMVLSLFFVSLSSAQSSHDECDGQTSELSEDEAIRFWTGPAESGDAIAQFCLGLTLRPPPFWTGGPPDREQRARDERIAMEWIRRSAEQGFVPAQEDLGRAYGMGTPFGGVPQDLDEARHWTQEAADQGSPWAHLGLAEWYLRGEAGFPEDNQQAYRHARLAVELFRAQLEPYEFHGTMSFIGLGELIVVLARELTVEDRTAADTWVKLQVQEFVDYADSAPPTGSYTVIANHYIPSVQGGAGQESDYGVLIEIDPSVEVTVRGECLPQSERCRVVVFWFYASADSVEFSDGAFLARNIQDHDIEYGSTRTGSEVPAGRDDGDSAQEIGKVVVVWLGDSAPEEFEFLMPTLKVNGTVEEMPVILFKHLRIVDELAPLY